jgi:serine/threonine protein kinase
MARAWRLCDYLGSAPPVELLVSHYRVLERLGEGGMGEVYVGIDETLKRRVALKAIRVEHRLDSVSKAL